MEFHEKLQELRKSRSLTQEELAEAIFVSRTAVSKWESGRGYPSIDSLKALSRFFCVTIDEMICSGEMVTVAENEKQTFICRYRTLLFGMLDIFSVLLLFLPVFGNGPDMSAVSLIGFEPVNPWIKPIFIGIVTVMALGGICSLAAGCLGTGRWNLHLLAAGMIISILSTAAFVLTRQPYAGFICFAVFVIKGMLSIAKQLRTGQ